MTSAFRTWSPQGAGREPRGGDYARRNAKVTFDDTKTNLAALTKATDDAGYPSFVADR